MSDPLNPIPDALDEEPMELPGADQPVEPAPFPGTDEDPPDVYIPTDEPPGVPIDPPIDSPRDPPLPM